MTDSKTTGRKVTDQSLESLIKTDDQLKTRKDLPELIKKWNVLPSDEALNKAVKALEKKNHKVSVVTAPEDAVKILTDAVKGKTFFNGGSMTLTEIGYTAWAMAQTDTADRDFKGQFVAALGKGDYAGAKAAAKKGFTANVFIGGAAAISQDGDIVWGSASGSRLVINGPDHVIIVVGSNKIVKDYDEAFKRMYDFQLPIESARARLAYKVPGSTLADIGALREGNSYGTAQVDVVIVKGQYGF